MAREDKTPQPLRLLVGIDFSESSQNAFKTIIEKFRDRRELVIFLVHVIDRRLIDECVRCSLKSKADLESRFVDAKKKLRALALEEADSGLTIQEIVCQGTPFHEINLQAQKNNVDIIVLGSCGMAGNPEGIFFGGTTEKVVRFIFCPVLCIPPHDRRYEKHRKKESKSSGELHSTKVASRRRLYIPDASKVESSKRVTRMRERRISLAGKKPSTSIN